MHELGNVPEQVRPSGHRDTAPRSTDFTEQSTDQTKGLWQTHYFGNSNSSLMQGPRNVRRDGSGLP